MMCLLLGISDMLLGYWLSNSYLFHISLFKLLLIFYLMFQLLSRLLKCSLHPSDLCIDGPASVCLRMMTVLPTCSLVYSHVCSTKAQKQSWIGAGMSSLMHMHQIFAKGMFPMLCAQTNTTQLLRMWKLDSADTHYCLVCYTCCMVGRQMWICALYLLCSRVCKVGARVYFSIEDGLLLMISIPGYLPSLTTYSCACADDSYGWASCEYTTDSLYNHSSDIVMHIAEITLRQMGRIVCVDLFMIIIPMFASSYYIINRCLYILIGIGMDDSDEADDHADRDDTHNMDSHQHNFYYNAKMLSIGIVITTISIFYALSHIANHNTNQSPSIISNSSQANYDAINSQPLSDQQLEQLLAQLSAPHISNTTPKQPKLKATPQAYMAYYIRSNPSNSSYVQLEEYYYNKKYNTRQYQRKQLPICVVAAGRNLMFQHRYSRFLDSVHRQNYNNFKLLIVIDDHSSDATLSAIASYLSRNQMKQFSSKTIIVANQLRRYALYNRHHAITNYCQVDDIIVELDSDDEFIGTQVLRTINAVYSADPTLWIMYSSYIYWSHLYGVPSQGISGKVPAKILQEGTYRRSTLWYTSATRTYLRKIYMKLDFNDFVDGSTDNNKDGDGGDDKILHKWTSDLFVHYSLVQLAGAQHYKYIHQIFYYYYLNHNSFHKTEKAISRLDSFAIRRYKQLNSLDDVPQRYTLQEDGDFSWLAFERNQLLNQLLKQNQKL